MKTLAALAAFLLVHALAAQSSFINRWSDIQLTVDATSDARFLFETDAQLLHLAGQPVDKLKNSPLAFESGVHFKILMTRAEAQVEDAHSLLKNYRSNFAELCLGWNTDADTLMVMSLSPMPVCKEGGCWHSPEAQFPLYNYTTSFISRNDSIRFHRLVVQQTARSLGAQVLKGDTLVRVVRLKYDGTEPLPQASLPYLLHVMKDISYYSHALPYRDSTFLKTYIRRELEETYIQWDSTVQVEDPYNPGVLILAPIKREIDPQVLIVAEKWIPVGMCGRNFIGSPVSYRREVGAIGMELEDGQRIWYKPSELKYELEQRNIRFSSYEELLRAQHYRQQQIHIDY